MKSKFKPYSMQRVCAAVLVASLQFQGLGAAYAAVSQLPGLYTTPPDSNVMFTLDDSGSMTSDVIPDFDEADPNLPSNSSSNYFFGTPGSSSFNGTKVPNMWGANSSYLSSTYYSENNDAARYVRSSAGNPLYYDPNVTYLPWPKANDNKTLNAAANPKKVNIDPESPFDTTRTIDLTAQWVSGSNKFWPATYFVYTGTTPLPTSSVTLPSRINSTQNVKANFTKVEITSDDTKTYSRPGTRTDCSATVCTAVQERQNFANWLQYYRSRALMAKGGVATAFAKQGTNLRVGLASLNASGTVRRGVAPFSGTSREAFFTNLYSIAASGGTPLRQAMDQVGKYFQRSDVGNPWAQDPSSSSVGLEYSCRRSFHILSTDGLWNGAGASTPASGNNDSFSGPTPPKPNGATYTYSDSATSATDPLVARFSTSPFADTKSGTLADVAAYYWKTDLRTDLKNDATPTARDPAYWQHLTTFTVGMGINGTGQVTKTVGGATTTADIATQAGRDLLIANRTPLNWTSPAAENAATGDDLIHASMNGRGRYFSATNPTELAAGLTSALAEAADTPVDLAAVAADSPQVAANGVLYQGTFSPRGWYGRLYAFPQDVSNGSVNTNPGAAKWEASNKMPAPDARKIFTMDTSGSVPVGKLFTWSDLNTTQKTALNNDATLLDYVRGSKTKELSNGGPFRDRVRYTVGGVEGGVLGDIVNGAPIKGPDAGGSYDRLPSGSEASSYATYRSGTRLDNMRSTLFAAANDGMLHGFDTGTGVERFAFVPNSVFSVPYAGTTENRLAMLADLAYPHRFLVDGPPNLADAYLGGQWKTVAVTSTGAGAKALFALDVTDPVVSASGFGTTKVMWEFTAANSADMGHVLGYAHIARMRNGAWAVIFGNGYDSQSGQAKLFVLDAASGTIIREFAVGTAGGNGLSMPNFILNANREVETIYAGDLQGRLWKFDVSSTNSIDWKVAFSGQPLFTTAGGNAQPITVMPEITANDAGGAMITFGTGKLFEAADTSADTNTNVNLKTQAIYSVWDKPEQASGTNASALQERFAPAIPAPPSSPPPNGEFQAMDVSKGSSNDVAINWKETTKRGWFINLSGGGERVNVNPQQFKRAVYLVTNSPNTADPCSLGGLARIFAIDPLTGLPLTTPVFDVNGDGAFTGADIGNILVNRTGILSQPVFQLSAITGQGISFSVSVSPLSVFNRGQATGGRSGGVELSRSYGGAMGSTPCSAVLSAGSSGTQVVTTGLNCNDPVNPPPPKTKRISWKQLK